MADDLRQRYAEADACVFCAIVAGEAPATVVRSWPDAIAIVPLNPVTEGHTLVIPATHVKDATVDPRVSALTMQAAAEYAAGVGPCNVITSVGREATQTVPHLHLHVVPRRGGDGLALPWTPHASQERAEKAEREAEQHRLRYNAANAMMGVHKRRADRLKTELEHAKGALAGDSEAVAGFMADHAEVLARAREQRDMWQRAAEQAEAAIDRAHALAESWAREPHPTHDHPCPDDVRRELLAALDGQEGSHGHS